MLSVTITLNNSQILDLKDTPVVIIPATETYDYVGSPTRLPIPIAAVAFLNDNAGGYTFDAQAQFVLALGSDWSWDQMNIHVSNITPGTNRFFQFVHHFPNVVEADGSGGNHVHAIQVMSLGESLNGGLYDNALVIALRNAPGMDALTGGDAANTMKLTVFYVLVDL